MKRVLIGTLLVLHGLAHSALGIWSTHLAPAWVVTPLWIIAQSGFIAAGLGLLGAGFFRKYWEPLAGVAAIASICYFEVYGELPLTVGLFIDVAVLVLGLMAGESALLTGELRLHTIAPRAHLWRHATFTALSVLFVGYVTLVIGVRPLIMQWGTTPDDQLVQLPGDELVPVAHYRIDHAMVIQAPPAKVWPWLAQIGQDRAGFYSYDWLERLFGDDIHNADRVYAAWQHRTVGELIPATQPDYLGGRLGPRPGWKVASWIEGEAIVLEGWGAFVLRPIDSSRTMLYIRTRGEGSPTVVGSLIAPAGVLLFEPVHFIMEREMLRGIKRRAEQPGLQSAASTN